MKFSLVMTTVEGTERPFFLDKSTTLIGSETRCDVRIPLSTVERRHCEIRREDGGLRLRDLGSAHGTFHNGTRVETALLRHADTLTIGPVTFTVRAAPRADGVDDGIDTVEITRRD